MAKNNLEKDLKRLEEIVAKMESEEVSLDDSMKLFEEGIKLSRQCSERLDVAERKVEILTSDKKGKTQTRPFEVEE